MKLLTRLLSFMRRYIAPLSLPLLLAAPPDALAQVGFKGQFEFEVWSAPDAEGNRSLKQEGVFDNGVTNIGKDSQLDVIFNSGTQITSWYLGLVDNAGFTAFANSDTMASHGGWTEFTTYTEATRPQWSPDAAASQQITNSTPTNFNITGSGTLQGIFVTSDNTKSGTTGTLWATASFAGTIPVANGDLLKITYTVTAT